MAGPAVEKAKAVVGDVAGKALQVAGPAVHQAKAVAGTAGQLVGGAVGEIKDRVLGPADRAPSAPSSRDEPPSD
jgi:hypothetical protein